VLRAHRVPDGIPHRERYLRLDLGEPDAPASGRVLETLRGLGDDAVAAYPNEAPLRGALAVHHGVPESQILLTAGSDDGIRWVFDAFVEEGARVVVPRPTFGAFLAAAQAAGAFVERVDYGDDLEFPLEGVERLLSPRRPRLVVLANPDAPTGAAAEPTAIASLAARSPQTLFLVDEVYAAFFGRSLLDRALVPNLPPNVLVLRSFSKEYGLPGLRVGYLVGHKDVVAPIDVARPSFVVSEPSLRGALAALSDEGAMRAHVGRVQRLVDMLVAELSLRGYEARATRASFALVRLSAPLQPWVSAFAARKILVGGRGHVGALSPWIRVGPTREEHVATFLEALDLIVAHGAHRATRVVGVPGDWDELAAEGMA
jgi:histidinol-phosphate aminotransferase